MISERCSGSSCPDDAAETVLPDQMVKIEMEAAEALANLAHPVERGSPGRLMAGKAKRGGRKVKCESPPSLVADSAPSCSDLAKDSAVLLKQQDERSLLPKAEQDDQLLCQSHICASHYMSFSGGRSSQNLSEAEKESKRLRRVLANRESARQTIRRRQALCEELARKAVELSNENEKLKKGKESALREYELLESTNKNLKAKVEKVGYLEEETTPIIKKAKIAKRDTVEHINVPKPSQTEMLITLPSNLPVLLHNAPFTPFMWPTLFQSSTANPSIMHGSHTLQASYNLDPCNEHSTINIASPVYIHPFPLFLGLPDPIHHCQTFHEKTEINVEMNNQQHHMFPTEPDVMGASKECVLSGEVMFPTDLNEMPKESPPLDEASLHEGSMLYRMTDAGSDLHLSLSGKEDVLPSSASDVVVSDQEKNHQGSVLALSGKKKLVDVTAAAEARRRRKELKKLKATHGRRCRMRC